MPCHRTLGGCSGLCTLSERQRQCLVPGFRPSVTAQISTHIWISKWKQQLMPISGTHVAGVLLSKSMGNSYGRHTNLLSCPSTMAPCWWAQSSFHTPLIMAHHTLAPSDCPHAANSIPPSLFCPLKPKQHLAHHSGLVSHAWECQVVLTVQVSLHFALCKSVVMISSETQKLHLCPS